MKKSVRFFLLFLSLLLGLALFTACGANSSDGQDRSPSPSSEAEYGDRDAGGQEDQASDQDNHGEDGSKIITTMHLSFETRDFEKVNPTLDKLMGKYKAYIENSNISHNHYYNNKQYRHGEFRIRLPKENLSKFRIDLEDLGNLISESINRQDVSKSYRDSEARLRVVTTKEERILYLLEKADKMEDIITLENQLSEVIYEKEGLEAELMNIDDKVDYATIEIDIQEVEKLSDKETIRTKFSRRLKNAVNSSFYGFARSMENIIILLIYILPFLILLGILFYLAYLVFKKVRKNKP